VTEFRASKAQRRLVAERAKAGRWPATAAVGRGGFDGDPDRSNEGTSRRWVRVAGLWDIAPSWHEWTPKTCPEATVRNSSARLRQFLPHFHQATAKPVAATRGTAIITNWVQSIGGQDNTSTPWGAAPGGAKPMRLISCKVSSACGRSSCRGRAWPRPFLVQHPGVGRGPGHRYAG
jgi:hypothetical protein